MERIIRFACLSDFKVEGMCQESTFDDEEIAQEIFHVLKESLYAGQMELLLECFLEWQAEEYPGEVQTGGRIPGDEKLEITPLDIPEDEPRD